VGLAEENAAGHGPLGDDHRKEGSRKPETQWRTIQVGKKIRRKTAEEGHGGEQKKRIPCIMSAWAVYKEKGTSPSLVGAFVGKKKRESVVKGKKKENPKRKKTRYRVGMPIKCRKRVLGSTKEKKDLRKKTL